MENGLELFYQGLGAVLFCLAAAVVLLLFGRLHETEEAVKANMEKSHIISVDLIE